MPSVSPASAPLPPFLIGGWADSLANIANRRYPTGTVQLQVELPLGNRTAKANLARSRIEQTQLARQRLQLEQAIEAEVRNALQAVESSNQRLRSATTARRNAQEQYDSERRRFDSGLSTVFLLLDRQTSLVTAQTLELRARADLNQAIAVFDRSIGATLQQHNVRLHAVAVATQARVALQVRRPGLSLGHRAATSVRPDAFAPKLKLGPTYDGRVRKPLQSAPPPDPIPRA